jgi:hypothetical protein
MHSLKRFLSSRTLTVFMPQCRFAYLYCQRNRNRKREPHLDRTRLWTEAELERKPSARGGLQWAICDQRGGGPTAIPHGAAPTRIVAITFSDAVSITETSFDEPLAVYRNLPSEVSPMPQGRAPTRT